MNIVNRYTAVLVIFVVANFLSAALLFLLEPMIGKALLPRFGGSSAVWNTCMVFYQAVLLAGYTYTHFSVKRFGLRVQPIVHAVVAALPIMLLPLALPGWAGAGGNGPVWQVLAVLTVAVGAPFFVLSTTGPLLQRWFAETQHPHAARPYFLYAAGNLGSFLALLAYPFVVEPLLTLQRQFVLWSGAYIGLCVLILVCTGLLFAFRKQLQSQAPAAPVTATSRRERLRWVFLAFLPSSLMLSVTAHITADVAAVPLFWVIPLALYLLTFVVVFAIAQPGALAKHCAPFAAAGLFGLLVLSVIGVPLPPLVIAGCFLAEFALVALVAHGTLSAERPEPARLTEFYLWVAVGGALGGVFNSLVAPLVFNDYYELPLGLLLTLPLLVNVAKFRRPGTRNLALALVPLGLFGTGMLVFVVLGLGSYALAGTLLGVALALTYVLYNASPVGYGIGTLPLLMAGIVMLAAQPTLFTQRTFYGVLKVYSSGGHHTLRHGVTLHGMQYTDPARALEPLSYYERQGPLGDAIGLCRKLSGCHDMGIIGLGTGTIAAYGQPSDHLTFYEIDPAMVRLARDPKLFTFLAKTPATITTRVADGRLGLERTTERYDTLILDAFSSDSIPTHLITTQAFRLYANRLTPKGVLIVHISNRQLNLQPIVKAAAASNGLVARVRADSGDPKHDRLGSTWVTISRNTADIAELPATWHRLGGPVIKPWTDDYSNIFDALRR